MMKYEAPEALLILLKNEDILADSANPLIGGNGDGAGSDFGKVQLW